MSLVDSVVQTYSYVLDELRDPRAVGYPLTDNLSTPLLVILVYTLLNKYGPKYMQNRSPFQLDTVVLIYNILQIVFNTYLFIAVLKACYIPLKYNLLCQPVGTATTPEERHIMNLVYYYYLIKIYDLLDTVFIVFRKKSSQLSFLHIYHHTGMILVGWVGIRYVPGGQSMFFGMLNCFVHSVMYSYYLLTVINPKFRTSWLKKRITQLQILQFVAMAVHLMAAALLPGCKYPSILVWMFMPFILYIINLFYRFYREAYHKRQKMK